MKARRTISRFMSIILAALFVMLGVTTAHGVPPLAALDGPITDQAGVITDPQVIEQAQADFQAATGGQFYVVFIDSFDGMAPQTWAQTTAQNANLGAYDLLLVVAVETPYWLQHGDGLSFTPTQEDGLVAIMDNSLDAGLRGTTTWGDAVSNIIGAFRNEITTGDTGDAAETIAPVETPTPVETPADVVEPGTAAPVTETTSGGMPTALRVVLIVVGVLAALFALWLLLGRFNERRLAKKAEQNPFNLT